MVTGSGRGAAAPEKTSGHGEANIISDLWSASCDRLISRLFDAAIWLNASRRKQHTVRPSLPPVREQRDNTTTKI
jgi:hypothetical protein